LNDRHTKREPITDFLIANFDLKYQKYTP